jgi:hypothetical protein
LRGEVRGERGEGKLVRPKGKGKLLVRFRDLAASRPNKEPTRPEKVRVSFYVK